METISKIDCLNYQWRGQREDQRALADQWEERWVQLAKKGDRVAFERIVVAFQDRVFNLAYRMLGDREEAEDLAQEVFIKVFKMIHKFRGESQFSTWIYQVTLNHCRNRIKYLNRRFHHSTESLDEALRMDDGESVERELPDSGERPEEVMYRQQVQALIHKALGRLRPEYREVVTLRDIQGLSYQEISTILDLPEGTIKSRLHRARWELKEILNKLGIHRGD